MHQCTLQQGDAWVCECVCIYFPKDPESVFDMPSYCHWFFLSLLHAEFFFSCKAQNYDCVWNPSWLTWGKAMQELPPVSSPLSSPLCTPLLQSYAVFSSLRSLSSHALDISSLPLALRYVLLSLGYWSINTTRSAPSCSKKSLPTLGTTKSVTDTNGKSNTFYCFAALGLGRWEFILKWKSDKKVHTQTHTPDHIVNVTLHLPTHDCFNKTPMKHLQTAYFECQKTENHKVHSSDAHI